MSDELKLNSQGGVIPPDNAAKLRARRADLGTLPNTITGTNCKLCEYYSPEDSRGLIGMCTHKAVLQPVTYRQCCIYFDCKGWKRV